MKRISIFVFALIMLPMLYWGPVRTDASVTDGRIVATIDVIETYGNKLHVRGWVYDKHDPGASITIDVDSRASFLANGVRDDVNAAFGISGQHGFDFEYTWSNSGVRVMITALYSDHTGGCSIYDNIAVFPDIYTVSYNANGGTGAPGTDYKHRDIALKLSSTKPSRTGYTFNGGSTSSNGSASYQPNGTYQSNSSTTLYAVWKKNTFTISYNANGGIGAPGSQTGEYQASVTLSNTVPTREGYDFKGWATSASGNASYSAGGKLTINGNTTLYAVWGLKTYSVTYNANSGEGAPGSQTKTYGQALTLTEEEPVKDAYVFMGWARNADAEEAEFLPGSIYEENAALKLFAVWTEARRPGDVNGDWTVDDADADLLLQYLAENTTDIVEQNADTNGDGFINGKDVLRLMKYLDGQDVVLE